MTTAIDETRRYLATRASMVVFGCIAVWWGVTGLSVLWPESSLDRIAKRVIAGDTFRTDVLAQQLAGVGNFGKLGDCNPVGLRSAAIVRTRMLESELSGNDRLHFNEDSAALNGAIRNALACAPSDPFLWLALNWVESTQHGFDQDYVKFLRLSYRFGPNEGWIALKRNRFALSAFRNLPPDLAELAIEEFTRLVDKRFIFAAGDIIAGPGWDVRDVLLPRLASISIERRQMFTDELYRRGFDLKVPGVEPAALSRRH